MTKKKKDTIKSLAIHNKDVGSAEIQIGLLTDKITRLSEHFKKFKKDKHSTLGLAKSVNKRKKLLAYLKKRNNVNFQGKKSSQRSRSRFRMRNKYKRFHRL